MHRTELQFPDLNEWDERKKLLAHINDPNFTYERKFDGTAAMVDIFPLSEWSTPVIHGRGILKDGSRQDYSANFPEMIEFFSKVDTFQHIRLLGELVCFNGEEYEKFKYIQQRVTRKYNIKELAEKYPATFMVFDIAIYGTPTTAYSYKDRRALLEQYLGYLEDGERLIIIPSNPTTEDKEQLVLKLDRDKFEGIVAKDLRAHWGTKVFKYKPTITEDVIWFGEYQEGTGKNEGKIGSLITYQYINGVLEEIAKVGGLTDSLRNTLTDLSHTNTVSKEAPMVIEVEAMGRNEPSKKGKVGKLRHPRFFRIRTDKTAIQCRKEI